MNLLHPNVCKAHFYPWNKTRSTFERNLKREKRKLETEDTRSRQAKKRLKHRQEKKTENRQIYIVTRLHFAYPTKKVTKREKLAFFGLTGRGKKWVSMQKVKFEGSG